jgi:Protein of unknown function (DUF3435)
VTVIASAIGNSLSWLPSDINRGTEVLVFNQTCDPKLPTPVRFVNRAVLGRLKVPPGVPVIIGTGVIGVPAPVHVIGVTAGLAAGLTAGGLAGLTGGTGLTGGLTGPTSEGIKISADRALTYDAFRQYLRRLGLNVGFESMLTPYCIRRGTANAVDGKFLEAGCFGSRLTW